MGPYGPSPHPEHDPALLGSAMPLTAASDLLLIDLAQGVACGGCFYLFALMLVHSLTPPSMVALMLVSLLWSLVSAWKLLWRDAAMAFGLTIGVSANLFAPILLFLLFLAGWSRSDRAITLPWAALGLSLYALVAGRIDAPMLAELNRPHVETLYYYYLVPIVFGSLSTATLSQFAVALARQRSLQASSRYLASQWLCVFALVFALMAITQALVRYAGMA